MGNDCCRAADAAADADAKSAAYTNMNKDESERCLRFGPMLLKESGYRVALLVAAATDDGFFAIQNILAKRGWQSAVAASDEEAEERFSKLWPNLVVVDARRISTKQNKSYHCIQLIRKLRSLTDDDGTVILAGVDKLTSNDEKQHRELLDAGASKVMKCCHKALADELQWVERFAVPLQYRLRACSALFTALENVDCAVEITSSDRTVQFVNSAYEQLTGCHKDEVLGTLSSDLRRKSLPKEVPSAQTSSRVPPPPPSSSSVEGNGKARTASADATSAMCSVSERLPTGKSISPGTYPYSTEKSDRDESEWVGWKCLSVPGPSSQSFAQNVYLKAMAVNFDGAKNGFFRRPPSIRFHNSTVDTPVTEILGLLKDIQKRCEHDEEIQKPIQKVVKILNSTELYSPLITRFKQEDKVASDLFGGLVLNGPVSTFQRSRKTSLSETMRSDVLVKSSLRNSSGVLRCISPDIRVAMQTEETWQFDILELERVTSRRPLVHLGMKIFERWRVREFLKCSDSCLRGWLEVIEAHYHPVNPYHNSTHAADVLQATAYYLGKDAIANILEHEDAVAALLASVIHDVDHPGRGSAFLINTKHPLALLYNDVSVLECHHAALGFQLSLSDPRINVFASLSRQDYTSLRKSMVDMVLATDMNKHFEYLAKFQQTVLTASESLTAGMTADSNSKDRNDPRRIVCRLLIKCADVSNPTRPWNQCKEWAYRIVEEYFVQTAEERAKGLPLTMEIFERDTCNVPLTQCSFIEMFIREMFISWSKFGDMPELLTHVEDNYKHWKEEASIWPKQRRAEFDRMHKYLKHRESFRNFANFTAGGSRSSVDSVGSAPPALVTAQLPEAQVDCETVEESSQTFV